MSTTTTNASTVPSGISSFGRRLPDLDGRPFIVSAAQGSHLWDDTGRDYVDYICGMGVAAFGHRPPAVTEAIVHALSMGPLHGMAHVDETHAAAALLAWAPGLDWGAFTNSGSEATSMATAIARLATGRGTIAKFAGSYHGWLGGLRFGAAGTPEALLDGPERPAKDGFTLMRYNDRDDVDALFASNDDIAAVIFEPILGNAACVMPEPGFLNYVAETARRHGALVIVDSVMVGLRAPGNFLDATPGILPDMTTLGKAMGGGFPVAALLGSESLRDVVEKPGGFVTAGTYTGSPMASQAVVAAMRLAGEEGVRQRAFDAATSLRAGLVEVLHKHGHPGSTSGIGSVFSLWIDEKAPTSYSAAAKAISQDTWTELHLEMRRRGVLTMPSRFGRFFTSTEHTPADVSRTLEAFDEVVAAGVLNH